MLGWHPLKVSVQHDHDCAHDHLPPRRHGGGQDLKRLPMQTLRFEQRPLGLRSWEVLNENIRAT